MNNSAQVVESAIQSLAANLVALNYEVNDLNKYYFASGTNTAISALATDTTPATTAAGGGLSKGQFINGMTFVGAMVSFFSNASVTQSDYWSTLENLIGGAYPASGPVSADAEAIGLRLKSIGLNCIQYYKQAKQALEIWNSSALTLAAGAMPTTSIVPGCSTVVSKFNVGIGLIQQYINAIENQAVSSGFWGTISSQWTQNS